VVESLLHWHQHHDALMGCVPSADMAE